MAEKNSFILLTKYESIFADMSDKQAGILIKAIFHYVATGEITDSLTDVEVKTAFKFVKLDLDYNQAKYDALCQSRSEYGKLGAQAKASISKHKPTQASKTSISKHNDNDVVVDTDIDNTKEKEVKEKEKPLAIAFDKFLNYRKQIKKPFKSQMSIDECYKRLEKLSGGNLALAEQIVNQSIAQGWQGLFDLKEGGNNNGGIDYNGKDADLSKYIEYERKNTKVFYNK